jgi:integrase
MAGRQAKILAPTSLHRMLEEADRHSCPARSRAIILLSFKAGLRAGEIAKLEWPMVLDDSGRVRVRKTIGLPRLSAYSYRHKVATVMRKARLPREEQDMQLGHARPTGYGEWEPDYLQGVADALDAWWLGLSTKVTTKSLFPPAPIEGENLKSLRTMILPGAHSA